MADQVSPMGSLAPGLPLMPLMAIKPSLAQESPRVAKPADTAPKGPEVRQSEVSTNALDTAAKAVKDYFQQAQSDLQFQVDESSGRMYFKIVDARTKEVIRQVPSEEFLVMARKLRELDASKGASGVLMDKEG